MRTSTFTTLTLAVLTVLTALGCRSTPETSLDVEIERKYQNIIIESFQIKDASIGDTIAKLHRIAKDKHGILIMDMRISTQRLEEAENPDDAWEHDDEEDTLSEVETQARDLEARLREEYRSQKLTINENNIQLPMLLKRIVSLADLHVSSEDGAISFTDKYALPSRYVSFNSVRFYQILPRYAYVFDKPKKFFERRGIFFGKDVLGHSENIGFVAKSNTLVVAIMDDEDRHKRIYQIIQPLLDHSDDNGEGEQRNSRRP